MKDFDWEYYIVKYPDLANAGINTRQKAIVHYKKYGSKEKRFGSKKEEIISKRITSNKKYKNSEKSINDDISNESNNLYKGFNLSKSRSESRSFSNRKSVTIHILTGFRYLYFNAKFKCYSSFTANSSTGSSYSSSTCMVKYSYSY